MFHCLRVVLGCALGSLVVGHSARGQAFALELESRVEQPAISFTIEGFVLGTDGAPAEGAVVVSSAGGRAVADRSGHYRFEVEAPREASSVQVTAVGGARSLVASTSVDVPVSSGVAQPGPLVLAQGSCQPSWLPTFGGQPGVSTLPSYDFGIVNAMVVYDDGSGSALYVGGLLETAGGAITSRIVKWDGSSWTSLGTGMDDGGGVFALTVFDDGGGPALYAGGAFWSAGGVQVNGIAKWDGSSWSALGSGVSTSSSIGVNALASYDDGGGAVLYAGGDFESAGGLAANHIARWDGASWSTLGGNGLNKYVAALEVYDDGSGSALYAGGVFRTAGGVAVNRLARWDGSSWSPLGSGVEADGKGVLALTVFDDGGGSALYAGGLFTSVGGVAANGIARWNGSSWSALGTGAGLVRALAVHDDGSGPALYAGGDFMTAGGIAAARVARWNGANWSALAAGLNGRVNALAVFDDGTGAALYAGGAFTSRIAKWNGMAWSIVGGGMAGGVSEVNSLVVHDDGSGPALYAGGAFLNVGGVPALRIARWNGTSWSALGSGASNRIHSLASFDDGSGAALYAAGEFTSAGGVAVNHLARWDGSSWSALGSGTNEMARALKAFDDGTGLALVAGGEFGSCPDSGDSFLARWGGCPVSLAPEISCPPPVQAFPSPGATGKVVTFTVPATDNLDPSPDVVCVPPSGSFFPRGTTMVSCTATDDLGNQSTCEFPVIVQALARRDKTR